MNADVVMFDATWKLSDRGEVFLNSTITRTDAEFDSLSVMFSSDVPTALFPDGLPVSGPDPTAPVSFSDYDMSEINEYSNLDYREWRSTIGYRYRTGKNVGVFASLSHYDLDDSEPYLQDATGSVTLVSAGLNWSF